MSVRSDRVRKSTAFSYAIGQEIRALRQNVLSSNLIDFNELCDAELKHFLNWKRQNDSVQYSLVKQHDGHHHRHKSQPQANSMFIVFGSKSIILCLLAGLMLINVNVAIEYFTSIRCFVPNNYMIWEATRPISNCQFCAGIDRPLILSNISQTEFLVS